uniref:hypothetical protein n=1 Tax=Desulfurococcus amylolyticus TaxID=94694 RepID=UPI0023F18475
MREASADQCPNPLIRDFKEQDLDEVVEIDKECFEELVRYDGGVFKSIPGEHDGSIIFYVAACNNGLGFRSYIGLFKLVSSLHPCSPCIPFGLAYGLGVFAGTLHLELRDSRNRFMHATLSLSPVNPCFGYLMILWSSRISLAPLSRVFREEET